MQKSIPKIFGEGYMKITFFHTNLNIGGIEKSLVNLANSLIDDFDIEIVLLFKTGKLLEQLDKRITVSEADKSLKVFGLSKNDSKKYGFVFYVKRNLFALKRKLAKNEDYLKKYIKKSKVAFDCDIAVSYSDDAVLSYLVLYKTNAKKKFAFYHSDFRNKVFKNDDYVKRMTQFDKFICVSKSCRDVTIKLCPQLKATADYLYNIVKVPENTEPCVFDKNYFNIITVARLSYEKRVDWAIDIIHRLTNETVGGGSYRIKYYICGNGKEYTNLKNKIESLNMSENIILLGETANPYPLIAGSDLMILLSKTESFGIALIESMKLDVPCLTTETISAKELVGDKGFVCEHDKEKIYSKLKSIFDSPSILSEKKKLLNGYNFDNESIVKRFKSFCD